eukprot:1158968-Pelagomonas_calceolata.AAC.8
MRWAFNPQCFHSAALIGGYSNVTLPFLTYTMRGTILHASEQNLACSSLRTAACSGKATPAV